MINEKNYKYQDSFFCNLRKERIFSFPQGICITFIMAHLVHDDKTSLHSYLCDIGYLFNLLQKLFGTPYGAFGTLSLA